MSTDIPNSLRKMFDEAEQKRLWFFSQYQHLWFSPSKLKEEQSSGRFRWGAENWRLRDPKERLEELRRDAANSTKEADDFERLLGATGEEVPA